MRNLVALTAWLSPLPACALGICAQRQKHVGIIRYCEMAPTHGVVVPVAGLRLVELRGTAAV